MSAIEEYLTLFRKYRGDVVMLIGFIIAGFVYVDFRDFVSEQTEVLIKIQASQETLNKEITEIRNEIRQGKK